MADREKLLQFTLMNYNDHESWNEEMAKRFNPDDFITKTGLMVRKVEAIRLAMSKKILDCGPNDVVLDLGCGPGNLLQILDGKRVVGLDLSDSLLDMARKRVQGRPQFEIVKSFAEKMPFPDKTFDRVVCSEVLEHVADAKSVIQEIRRVSKPGALVVLTVPNEELINFCKKIVIKLGLKKVVAGGYGMSDNMLSEWHKAEIEPDWVMEHCIEGFEHVKTVSIPVFFFPLHRAIVLRVKK